MSDAAHMASDLAGFLVSIVAILLARRSATARLTFGFQRAEVIGAVASVLLMWGLTGFLLAEAVERCVRARQTGPPGA
jgi:solute carrier family 30 (zinc transporter), member 2